MRQTLMDAQWLWGMSSSHSARWKAASLGYHLVTQWHHSLFMHTGRISPPDVLGVPHPQLWWLSAFAHTDFLLRTNHPFTFSLGDPVQTTPVCPSLLCRLLNPHSWTHLQLLHQADHVAICFARISTEARCSAFCLQPSIQVLRRGATSYFTSGFQSLAQNQAFCAGGWTSFGVFTM